MATGFVPSYVLTSGIAKKIARLKGLERGWHYPTYLVYYVRNPAPLLLFDEIIIDEEAGKRAVALVSGHEFVGSGHYEGRFVEAFKPTASEGRILHQLIESELFRKEQVANVITDDDFEFVKKGYERDMGMTGRSPQEFKDAVAILEKRYGENYASPYPLCFEAMNINLTWILLRKFSAMPLDDILRSPLYDFKAIETLSADMNEVKIAYKLVNQARQVLYLPTEPLANVDAFLDLHKDTRVRNFREKVHNLSQKKATAQQISKEIYNANCELQKLDVDKYNIVIAFFGLLAGLTTLRQGNFITGSFTTGIGLTTVGRELRKVGKARRYGWLGVIKGLHELDTRAL